MDDPTDLRWIVYQDEPWKPAHLIPLHDLRDHKLDNAGSCWCRPDLSDHGLVDHNSLDQRERYGKRHGDLKHH